MQTTTSEIKVTIDLSPSDRATLSPYNSRPQRDRYNTVFAGDKWVKYDSHAAARAAAKEIEGLLAQADPADQRQVLLTWWESQ